MATTAPPPASSAAPASPPPMTRVQRLTYGSGAIANGIKNAAFSTYLLLFYHKVLQFDNQYAGAVLLVGQLADGVSTTIVGLASDRCAASRPWARYGARKSWHLLGTVCVVCSFPFIFLRCQACTPSSPGLAGHPLCMAPNQS